MKNRERKENHCEKCGYDWHQQKIEGKLLHPLYCPRCGRAYWWIGKEKTKEG